MSMYEGQCETGSVLGTRFLLVGERNRMMKSGSKRQREIDYHEHCSYIFGLEYILRGDNERFMLSEIFKQFPRLLGVEYHCSMPGDYSISKWSNSLRI